MSPYSNGDISQACPGSFDGCRQRGTAVFSRVSTAFSRTGSHRPDIFLPVALFAAQLILFTFLAFHRIIDSDEGFYLYASKLLADEGTLVYRDFFYPQMPLLPFIYGGWMKVFGFDWYAGRALSASLTALTGTMLYQHVRESTGRGLLAVSALLLYAFNLSVLLFFLTAKTYALSTTLLFAGLIAGTGGDGTQRRWRAFAAGLLLGLSVQVRLFFIVTAPILGLWLWRCGEDKPNRLPWLLGSGFVIGSVPSLLFLLVAPLHFSFDTLVYHSVRNPFGLIAQSDQKLGVVAQLVLGTTGRRPTQFSMLFAAVPLGILLWKKLNDTPKVCIMISIALGIVSVLPTPAFVQYFCVLVPFLIILLAGSLDALICSLHNRSHQRAVGMALLACSLLYAGWATTRMDGLFIGAEMAPGPDSGTGPHDWKIPTIERVASITEEHTRPDALVVSKWPGYLLTANRRIYPGMENQFSLDSSMRIPAEQAARYRMMRESDVGEAIADPATEAVIIGNWSHKRTISYAEVLDTNNYRLVGQVGNADVFARIPADPARKQE